MQMFDLKCSATQLIGEAYVGAHDLQHAAVDVLIGDAFDVAISNLLVPDLQWLGAVRAVRMMNTGLMIAMRGGSSPDAIQN